MNPKVPIMVGSNYVEGNLFAFLNSGGKLSINQQEYLENVQLNVPQRHLQQVLQFYAPLVTSNGYWFALAKLLVLISSFYFYYFCNF